MSVPGPIILSKSNPSQIKPKARNQQITYYWSPPASDGGSPIDVYTIRIQDSITSYFFSINAPSTTFTFTGATNGQEYTGSVFAHNAVGDGPYAFFRTVQPGFKPGPPTNVLVTRPTSSTALVSWTAPVYTGEATIKWNVVKAVSNNIADPVIKLSAYGYSTEWLVKDLNPASTYTFTVYAVNDPGYSVGASPEIIKSGLLLELESSNYTGGTWNDSSGYGNNATVAAGGTGQTVNGFVYFNGSTYFEAPSLGTLSNFTLSLWYRPFVTPSMNTLLFGETYFGSAGENYSIQYSANGVNGLPIGYSGYSVTFGIGSIQTTNINIANNVWNNVVVTYDGSNLVVYLNNIIVDSSIQILTLVSNGVPISLGGGLVVGDANGNINGLIGQALIYNRALTAGEVTYNYNVTSPTYP